MSENQPVYPDESHEVDYGKVYFRMLQPLRMQWKPQKDITAYELAQCFPYMMGQRVMPGEIGSETFFRHFEIIDINEY